ncbi:MAG TPA: protein kinase [Gemmatimonadaceae bacterium]|nr:protein kinase [Gemmatimonadaceae bacterium]
MNSREQMQQALGSVYAIERELDGGGMSRVFVATETSLGRRIVIKVLSPELTGSVSTQRFAREVRLAASLQQANIVPVLATGDANGLPYYTMPFVEGLSLRERIQRDGRPPLAEAIGILRDVARALAFAHERGVVHRDIKPENVLLSGDAAVVTDFGIAKALASARLDTSLGGEEHGSTVTQAGTTVGTPPYMAPEQVAGDPSIDHRADLYSLGCLAYELLTGAAPFGARSLHSLFSAHLAEQPTPVGERCPECPPTVSRLVTRCLEKDPDSRPQSAREILAALAGGTTAATPLERLWQRRTRPQRALALSFGAAVALAAVAATVYSRGAGRAAPASLVMAVVPFINLSGDSAQEYITDGIADELATSLGKVAGIRIASRSLSYRYKGRRDLDARELGDALSAAYVLQGSVRPIQDRMRVSVQLINAVDNSETWSESYDRAAADAIALQSEIVVAVVDALRRRLGLESVVAAAEVASTRSGVSAEAYDEYLHGRFLLRRRGAGVRQAIERFEQAVSRDSNFAQAYAALAIGLELLPYFEPVDARALGVRAIAAAQRALALDSSLAEAHTALAMAYQHLYRWQEAEAEYRRAASLSPNDLETHIQYGRFLYYMGRIAEARAIFERARSIDPYSAVASGWYGHLLFADGKRIEGLREIRRALEFEPSNPPALVFMAGAYRQMGLPDSSMAYAERLRRDVPAWSAAGAALLGELGNHQPVLEAIRALEAQREVNPQANVLLITLYAALEDSTRTMEAMERATMNGEIWPTWRALSDPAFDFIRRSARFAAIVRSAGLDARIFTSATGARSQ